MSLYLLLSTKRAFCTSSSVQATGIYFAIPVRKVNSRPQMITARMLSDTWQYGIACCIIQFLLKERTMHNKGGRPCMSGDIVD